MLDKGLSPQRKRNGQVPARVACGAERHNLNHENQFLMMSFDVSHCLRWRALLYRQGLGKHKLITKGDLHDSMLFNGAFRFCTDG